MAESQGNYSHTQFEQANATQKLCHVIGALNVKNFKGMLRSNQMRICPVTEKDTDLAEKIFGPDVTALKGKSVHATPNHRIDNTIAAPKILVRMHSNIHMCINIMVVNRIGFLTSIGCQMCYQKTVYLEDNKGKSIYKSLDNIMQMCNKNGYQVRNIPCDDKFKKIMDGTKD